jgi:SAM-dependent methyltransferase
MQHPRIEFARRLPAKANVLDVGCWNYGFWRLCQDTGLNDFTHHGVDREVPPEPVPAGYGFELADLDRDTLPFDDDALDGVFVSHVLEHVARPFALLDECFRVMRLGGLLYLECPSTRSLWLPSMPFAHHESRSLSFFDDPTHIGRPHTPQSLHRLLRMYGAEVIEATHITSWAVRVRFPWLLAQALLQRNAALLEDTVWKAVGFAVFAVGRKSSGGRRRYVLP